MRKHIIPVVLILVACIQMAACHKTDNDVPQPASLSFEWTHLVKKEGDCSGETSPCLTVDLKYPVAIGGGDSIRQAINTYMDEHVHRVLINLVSDSTDSTAPTETLILLLSDAYKNFVREYPEAPSQWSVELKTAIIRNDSAVVSFKTEVYTYMGGAHPLSVAEYASFFTATGRRVQLNDIVSDKKRLTTLAEQVFRRERELTGNDNLDSAGFWFGEKGFSLPDNFAVSDSSLVFYYNPYEIAPYVFGPTLIEVPYSGLTGSIDKRVLRQR